VIELPAAAERALERTTADGGAATPVAVLHLGRNGGGPKFTHALAEALQAVGRPVVTVVSSGADNRGAYHALGPVLELPTFRSTIGAALRAPVLLLHALRLRRFLTRHEVRVVVVAMEQIWQGPLLGLLGRRRRILLCVHDATMHPGRFNAVEHLSLQVHRALADGAVTFSDHVASVLEAQGAFPPGRIQRSVHGAYAATGAAPRSARSGVPVIGFFGRLSEYKGLRLAHEAVEILRAAGRRIRFEVVGDGADPALARMTHPDDHVEVGWVDDRTIPEILDRFDVLALPYLEASQSGVFAYAAGRGLPMVVTPVGGLREQAESSGAALVADAVTADAVADRLTELLDDPARYLAVSTAGVTAAAGSHSWARTARDVLTGVAALEAEPRSRRPSGGA
jgi:glycosyltransferase involved in cell wall biosynthesis